MWYKFGAALIRLRSARMIEYQLEPLIQPYQVDVFFRSTLSLKYECVKGSVEKFWFNKKLIRRTRPTEKKRYEALIARFCCN